MPRSLKAARRPGKAEPEEEFRIDVHLEEVIHEAFQPAEDIIEDSEAQA